MKTDKLDKAISEYVRRSAADEEGFCVCPLCGSRHHWKQMDNAHFIPRANMSTRFLLMNLICCCVHCNRFLDGNLKKYESYLKEHYGPDAVMVLTDLGHTTVKFTQVEINELVKEYKQKIKELDNQ